MEKRMIKVLGQEWNVATIGPDDAEHTLVLCNGIGASVDTIKPFARHFSGCRIISFDVPGVGDSPTPVIPYRFKNLTRMINRILDVLGAGKVHIFGVSWGGALAQQFAYDFQNRCRSLTLAATAAGMVMVPGNLAVLSKMVTPRRYTDPNFMMTVGAEIYGGEVAFNTELLQDHAMAMRAGDKRGYLFQLLAGLGWSSYIWLSQIKLPTLILMGEDDPLVPPVNGKILLSRLPNAELETVPCGHMFVLTKAEIVADRVQEFIREQGAKPVARTVSVSYPSPAPSPARPGILRRIAI